MVSDDAAKVNGFPARSVIYPIVVGELHNMNRILVNLYNKGNKVC